MASRLHRATTLVLYQLSLLVGIAMLPVALATEQLGVSLPVHRLVERLGTAYERTSA